MEMVTRARRWSAVALCCVGTLLSACGGGGGGSGSSSTATAQAASSTTSSATGSASESSGTLSISGTAPAVAIAGTAYKFQPQTTSTSQGTLTYSISNLPGWASFDASTGLLAGTPSASDVGTDSNITISVSNGTNQAELPAFNITVSPPGTSAAVSLSWDPPTQNTNGTALVDLAGFRIYYGTQSQDYTTSIQVADPGTTTYSVSNLTPGTYYFAVVAYDSAGNQSAYSPELSATID